LYFSSTSVHDLSPLLNLNFLQQVHGNFTEVKNLNPLAKLPNLKFAYFDNTKVERPDFLNMGNKNTELVLVYQTRFLQNWWETINDNWKELFIKKINIKNDELSKEALQQIADIKSLNISNNLQLKTLEPLKVLSTLEELIFSGTQISNLSALENLKQLSKITCANNPINDLSAIMNLPNLKYLDISNIPIRDFEQIQFMTSLETLICPGTQIKSLKYLEYLRNLKTLECFNTNIRNLNALENLDLDVLKCYNTGLNQKRVAKYKATHPNTEVVYY
jgi:Leucine-rich repeat (LRR) protein